MTRKRLTDLLREEAQKPATDSPLTVDVVAAPVTVTDDNSDGAKSQASVATSTSATTSQAPNTTESIPEAKPQKTAPEPQASPQLSPDLEAELRQQITELKHSLHINQTNVEILQSTIQDHNQNLQRLKTELEESRKDNLRLAEANIQLKEELQKLQTPVVPVTTSSRPAYGNQIAPRQPELRRANATSSAASAQAANASNSNNSSSLSRSPARPPERPQSRPLDRPGIYGRPIGSNEENQRINNRNIGWMD